MPEYWISNPHLLISKIKVCVDRIINDGFQNGGGRVSIKKIYDVLKAAPYGFMSCNLSAFILGFVLKEYASGTYSSVSYTHLMMKFLLLCRISRKVR